MSHVCMSYGLCMNEPRCMCIKVMSHVCISHGTCVNESCHILLQAEEAADQSQAVNEEASKKIDGMYMDICVYVCACECVCVYVSEIHIYAYVYCSVY